MVRIKPAVDGFNDREIVGFASSYDGPPPPAGLYHGVVKRMGVAAIASGENAGAQRIPCIIEISDGKYAGAGIFHNFNLTDGQKAWFNLFLDALTDGSQKQKDVLQKWFWHWPDGWDLEDDPMGKLGQQFKTIGKNFKPIGKKVTFVTRMGRDQYDEPRAEIAKFVTPSQQKELDDDETSDALGEFLAGSTQNPEPPVPAKEPEPEPIPVPAALDTSSAKDLDDDDDPWS